MAARPARRPLPAARPRPIPTPTPAHVIVFATLGAPERRRLAARRRTREAPTRARPHAGDDRAGDGDRRRRPAPTPSEARGVARRAPARPSSTRASAVLNRALHAFRLVTADPYLHTVGRAPGARGPGRVRGRRAGRRRAVDRRPRARRSPTARQRRVAGARSPRPAWPPCSAPASGRWPARSWRCGPASTSTTAATARPRCSCWSRSTPRWPSCRRPAAPALADRLTELRGQREAVAAAAQAALGGPARTPSARPWRSRWGGSRPRSRARGRGQPEPPSGLAQPRPSASRTALELVARHRRRSGPPRGGQTASRPG